MDDMVIRYECGIDYDRLRDWLQAQDLGGCEVEIVPDEPRCIGPSMAMPRTHLKIAGPPDAVRELYHRFELQFMSSGG